MKINAIREKKDNELKELLLSLKREYMNLRFQKALHTIEKTSRIREVRRTIAKINTVVTERSTQGVTADA